MTDGEVDQFRERALAFLQAGQWEKASALLDMLVVLGQGDAETLFLAAGCSDALGREVNARAQFREAVRLAGPDQRELIAAALEWGRHLAEPGAA
jgi:Flp pilus assembly protein TadD